MQHFLVSGLRPFVGHWETGGSVWGCSFYGALTGRNQVGQEPNATCVIKRVLIRLAEFLKHLIHGDGSEFPGPQILRCFLLLAEFFFLKVYFIYAV